jgi:hypothetical protein
MGLAPMFFIGGLPALLALFVRFRVKESKVWEKKKAESWTSSAAASSPSGGSSCTSWP